ncbi:hypothetical protein HYH03_012454 [Edaphochlamys debaryana]|uniref:Peptidase M60 domain-containing protein n=1 Tax=Edaphochlamys debaryana TaxID=47281 RepID=A0A835XRZ7_9CHLO|nr:hypothetical protein HYH03_012454 [Edaphochlamys debaryana]|eukprot:KAG2489016.1 hypothetical protein HYH03_012454 [Edaphochlamys debaryana]
MASKQLLLPVIAAFMALMSSTTSALWPASFTPAANALLNGVAGPYVCCDAWIPGVFALWSRDAFPIVLSGYLQPVVVAAAPSPGPRVMGFAHEAMVADALQGPAASNRTARTNIDKLVLNALRWLAWDRTGLRVAIISGDVARWTATGAGFRAALNTLSPALPSNWTVTTLAAFPAASANYDLLIIDAYQPVSLGQANAINNWLKGPKRGLLVAGHAWGWGQANPTANIFTQLPINQLLWPYGIALTKSYEFSLQDASTTARAVYPYYSGLTAALTVVEQLQGSAGLPALSTAAKDAIYRGITQTLAVLPRRTDVGSAALLGEVYAYLDIVQVAYPAWANYAPPGTPEPDWGMLNITATTTDKLAAARAAYNTHQAALLRGVFNKAVSRKQYFSTYAIWAPFAWPFALSPENPPKPVAVASMPLTGGRVVAFGHEGIIDNYVYPMAGDASDLLVLNAFRWLGWGLTTIRICTATDSRLNALNQGLRATTTPAPNVTAKAISLDALSASACEILVLDVYTTLTPNRITLIKNFLRAPRKGLMVAGQIWSGWDTSSLTKPLTTTPVNRLLWDLGFIITPDSPESPKVAPANLNLTASWLNYNAWYSTMQLLQYKYRNTSVPTSSYITIYRTLTSFLDQLPGRTDPAVPAYGLGPVFAALFTARRVNPSLVVGPNRPMYWTTAHPVDVLDVYLDAWVCRTADMGEPTRRSRHAAAYPGIPGAGANLTTMGPISINATNVILVPGSQFRDDYTPTWRSTGAWFNPTPGKSTILTVSANAVNKGLMVQIGNHEEDLTNLNPWKRVPTILTRFPITSINRAIASPMGGLIYIVLPPGTTVGQINVTLTNVIQAPRYVQGKTTLAQWGTLRNLPVPWTELEGRDMILHLPSARAKTIADPGPLLTHWNRVLDAQDWLSANVRFRAERFNLDADITVGWMHSGYPMQAFDLPEVSQEISNLTQLQTIGAWGPYHELGHQHQWDSMEYGGTTEASVNLFTMYAMESTGVTAANVDRLDRNWLLPVRSCYFRNTPNPNDLVNRKPPNWTGEWSVWIALDTLLQLKENFGGWIFYRRLFTEYIASGYESYDDAEKTQHFILTTSKIANRNLVRFFEIWGFPIAAATRTAANVYPAWTTNPMLTWKPSATDSSARLGAQDCGLRLEGPSEPGLSRRSSEVPAPCVPLLVVLGGGQRPVVVAAAPSPGPRVMGFAHEAMLTDALAAPADTNPTARSNIDKLVLNALRWLAWDRTGLRVGYITNDAARWTAAAARFRAALNTLSPALASNWTATTFPAFPAASAQYDLLIIDAYQYSMTSGESGAVINWLRGPKRSLLAAGQAWGWAQASTAVNLFTQLPINRLLWQYGIILSTAKELSLKDASNSTRAVYPYYSGLTAALTIIEQLQGEAHNPALTQEAKAAVYQGVVQFLSILPRRTDLATAATLSQVYAYLDIVHQAYPAWAGWAAPGTAAPAWAPLNIAATTTDKLAAARAAYNTHQAALLRGVYGKPVNRTYWMSTYEIWAPYAWPIALSPESPPKPVAVASTPLTGGRVVAFGHHSVVYFYKAFGAASEVLDTLVVNAFRWLGWGQTNIRICTEDYYHGSLDEIALDLRASTTPAPNVTVLQISLDTLSPSACDVLFIDSNTDMAPAHVGRIQAFLRAPRKGLLLAGALWLHYSDWGGATKPLVNTPVNRLMWSQGFYTLPTYPESPQAAPASLSLTGSWLNHNAWFSAMQLLQSRYGNVTISANSYGIITDTLASFLDQLPGRTDPAVPAYGLGPVFAALFAARRTARALVAAPLDRVTAGAVDRKTGHPSEVLDVYLDAWVCRTADMGEPTRLSRYAAAYPGVASPTAVLRTIRLSINATSVLNIRNSQFQSDREPTWRSTGAWFHPTPGKTTILTVSPNAVNKGLMVQIGLHTQDISGLSSWKRVPVMHARFPITSTSRAIANPMGGLIYIVVPAGTTVGQINVTLTNVIQAPRYVQGETTLAQWGTLRNLPVPWTELEGRTVVLQLPSKAAKAEADPAPLLTHWDQVLDSMAYLSSKVPFRAERLKMDVVALGAAGYPAQVLDVAQVARELANLTHLKTYGAWEPYSQLGRAHQWGSMDFDNSRDATGHLFAMFVMESTSITARNEYRMDRTWLLPVRSCYFRDTPNPADLANRTPPDWAGEWGGWVGLDTLVQLKEAFGGGWEFYRRVFADYIASGLTSTDDGQKVQRFILTTSKIATERGAGHKRPSWGAEQEGSNLVPFFEIWGFPIAAATRTAAAAYPAWTTN